MFGVCLWRLGLRGLFSALGDPSPPLIAQSIQSRDFKSGLRCARSEKSYLMGFVGAKYS
jgi:hypothetical protein